MSILYLSCKSDCKYCQNQKLISETLETKLGWALRFFLIFKAEKKLPNM